ncbi:ABC transporter permease [Antarctobacter sp.]|uniref:ABC transporter permease n=1 Tax=Antarctobacter sp. TaxID=1872577 RepID=UPI002B2737F5|nr:ABC transporter permease [Antarctobacter sp.]
MMGRINPVTAAAAAFLVVVALLAILGEYAAPHDPYKQNLLSRLTGPAWTEEGSREFLLGTDKLGRDLLSRLIVGLQMSVGVALLGTFIGALVGTIVGFISGHFEGWVDNVLMMVVDIQLSLPFILIALTLLAFFGNSMPLFILLMGMYGWETYARLARGLVLSAKRQTYSAAIVSLGATSGRLYLRHILPNIASALIVQLTLTIPAIILLETALSFLGLGIQPPDTSLGQILGEGRDYLASAWWIAVFPGLIIFCITLSVGVVGDALRDKFDPTLKARQS